MARIKYTTAGESHGKMLVGIIENVPAGLYIDGGSINGELKRRMLGLGRGARMKIESDSAEFVTGVRAHMSLGGPITAVIENKDFKNWERVMGADAVDTDERTLTAVRPGHADLSGVIKYGFDDARNVLERASARETAAKVALGAVAKLYLAQFGIVVQSHTLAIGAVKAKPAVEHLEEINAIADADPVRCLDKTASAKMVDEIRKAALGGDTLGGVSEIIVTGCKSGIGSYVSAHRKLDGLIMREVGAVQSVKAVEIGDGMLCSSLYGSLAHDEIYARAGGGYERFTNRAGGLEGGMTNGQPIVVRAYFKPIPTLKNGLNTVDIKTGKAVKAASERSDVCAVPAGGVVAEAAVALAVAAALSDMLGGDTMKEAVKRYEEKESC